jgi:hypothetical protein
MAEADGLSRVRIGEAYLIAWRKPSLSVRGCRAKLVGKSHLARR